MKNDHSLSKLSPDTTLAQIVSADKRAAGLLSSIGVDLHRSEQKTLREVCVQKQWSELEVLKWINNNRVIQHREKRDESDRQKVPTDNDLPELCSYLVREYHSLIYGLLSDVRNDYPRVCKIHGNQYTWLKDAAWHFSELHETGVWTLNFKKEKFFPLIRQLQKQSPEVLDGTVRKLNRSIDIVAKDREKMLRHMNMIRHMSGGLNVPEGACSTFSILIDNIRVLFSDLGKMFEIDQDLLLPAVRRKIRSII